MSKIRQNAILDRLAGQSASILTLTHDYPAGRVIPLHFHDRDQLVYASRGVMTVRTSNSTWGSPDLRAVWIPETVPHTITMSGTVAMRTLYHSTDKGCMAASFDRCHGRSTQSDSEGAFATAKSS
jgi:hypothetical protein